MFSGGASWVFNDTSSNGGILNGGATFNWTYTDSSYIDFSLNTGTVYGSVSTNLIFTNPVTFTEDGSNVWTYDTSGWTLPSGSSWMFTESSSNTGEIGNAVFNGHSFNLGGVWRTVSFHDSSYNQGSVDVASFYDSSYNTGTNALINWTGTFYDSSHNDAGAYQAVFNGSSYNSTSGWVENAPTFNDSSQNQGTAHDDSYGRLTGVTIFNDSSSNIGIVDGDATFNNSSANSYGSDMGVVSNNADVYYPVIRPLVGTIGGVVTYHGYPNLYFNDKNTHDGDWGNVLNWWTNESSTAQASVLPGSLDEVTVLSTVVTNTVGNASVKTATFKNTAQNKITISASAGTFFENSSSNSSPGEVFGTTTFSGNSSNNNGSVSAVGVPSPGYAWTTYGGSSGVHNWSSITSSSDGMTLFAVSTDNGLLKSVNGGKSWSSVGGNAPSFISSSSDGAQLVGGGSAMYITVSTDGGKNWGNSESSPYTEITAVSSSVDGSSLSAVSGDDCGSWCEVVYQSSDGGANWFSLSVSYPPSGTDRLIPLEGSSAFALIGESDPNIQLTNDNGNSWNSIYSSGSGWKDFAFSADGSRMAAISSDGGVYESFDGGTSWFSVGAGGSNWSHIAMDHDGVQLFVTENGGYVHEYVPEPNNAGPVYRQFTSSATTTRNFTTEGGRNNWIIQAYNSVVDLSGAIYSRVTNIFQAFANSIFNSNPSIDDGAAVVPQVVINSPVSGTNIKWVPSVTWDTASTCEYKMDSDDYSAIDCSKHGLDIPRPSATSHVLFVKGTDSNGNLSERSVTFNYDNTQPVYTTCGTDYLDEATRPYYYLQGEVTGDCVFKVNTELRGASTTDVTGFTVNGNIYADVTLTAKNLTLKNINVTGYVSTSVDSNGYGAGSLTINNAVVSNVIANGHSGGAGLNGGNGGSITIATSTTGTISANGGDTAKSGGRGGDGGHIIIVNSSANASSTTVSSVGGNSTVCGYGGSGGNIDLTYSTDYVKFNNKGSDHSGSCTRNGQPGSAGGGTVVTRPVVTPPSVVTTVAPTVVSGAYSPEAVNSIFNFGYPNSAPLIIPVATVKPLTLANLPIFGGEDKNSFSFENVLSSFLKAPFPNGFSDKLKKAPELKKYLASLGIEYVQSLVNLRKSPINLPVPIKNTDKPAGLLMMSVGATSTPLTLVFDKVNYVVENATTTTNTSITISLYPVGKGAVTATFAGNKYTFKRTGNSSLLSVTLTTPSTPGRYTFSASGAPLDLSIDVVAPPPIKDSAPPKSTGVWNFFKLW